MKEFKPRFIHRRTPEHLVFSKRGQPRRGALVPYSRKMGFMSPKGRPILIGESPHARGGSTRCYIVDNAGTVAAWGEAICSLSDNFNYRIGREIALARATKRFEQWLIIRELKEEIQVHGHC